MNRSDIIRVKIMRWIFSRNLENVWGVKVSLFTQTETLSRQHLVGNIWRNCHSSKIRYLKVSFVFLDK